VNGLEQVYSTVAHRSSHIILKLARHIYVRTTLLAEMYITHILALTAFAFLSGAEPIPGDGVDCQKKPERCATPVASSVSTKQASSTAPLMPTTTYTTSFCSVTGSVHFTTKPAIWYEQSCTQIVHTTTTTDYSLQWGCETSTVTAAYTMDNKFAGQA
jgi:hypothetical protein